MLCPAQDITRKKQLDTNKYKNLFIDLSIAAVCKKAGMEFASLLK